MIHLGIDKTEYLLNFVHGDRHYVIGPFAQWVDIEIAIAEIEELGLDELDSLRDRYGATIKPISGTVGGVDMGKAQAQKLYSDLFGDWDKVKDDAERGIYNKRF